MKKSIFLLVLVAPLILSGCIPGGKLSGTNSTEKSGFVQGAAVAGFPAIPLYPKSKIIESYTDSQNYGGTAYSTDSLEKVVDFYTNAFKQFGWENSITRQAKDNFLIEYRSDKYKGEVIVNTASDGKRVAITIVASPR